MSLAFKITLGWMLVSVFVLVFWYTASNEARRQYCKPGDSLPPDKWIAGNAAVSALCFASVLFYLILTHTG